MDTTKQPKVFISYSWGDQEHQMKVLALATSLVNDGINVLLDKWELSAGNDMNHFMEKSVTDPTVDKVLLLLDKEYAFKADNRAGGVGTETQIISQQVYDAVEQDKFIPVIFERDSNGEICKPAYLKSRFHYDLSREEDYDREYRNLIRNLYGVATYKKPQQGMRPAWVDEQIAISPKRMVAYDSLKEYGTEKEKKERLFKFLSAIEQRIIDYTNTNNSMFKCNKDYIEVYESNRGIRKEYLLLLENSVYCKDRMELIGDFLERVYNYLEDNNSAGYELSIVFLHELFLYTIAILLKKNCYDDVGYLLGRTYFPSRPSLEKRPGKSYLVFYSGSHHMIFDNAIKEREGKNYYSGTANYWITSIDADFCTKEDFVAADLVCFNYSVYGNEFIHDWGNWAWFPITYVYDNEYKNYIVRLSKKITSKEKLDKVLRLFNYETSDKFIERCTEVENSIKQGEYRDYRHSGAFEPAPLISYTVKAEEIGTLR